jgi:nucleotide-binding universal stress UspA family protein
VTSRRQEDRDALANLGRRSWPAFLREHSGLPGARANLELAEAVAEAGDAAVFATLVATDDEYLVLCGVVGLGQLLAEAPSSELQAQLREHAADARWRIREGVAMALQRIGDVDPARLRRLTDAWAADADLLVQRAAVAGVCEPRLLRTAATRAHALALCQEVTDSLAARPAVERAAEGVRSLRQALAGILLERRRRGGPDGRAATIHCPEWT